MSFKTWKALSKAAKFIKYRVNRKAGERIQDLVDSMYPG